MCKAKPGPTMAPVLHNHSSTFGTNTSLSPFWKTSLLYHITFHIISTSCAHVSNSCSWVPSNMEVFLQDKKWDLSNINISNCLTVTAILFFNGTEQARKKSVLKFVFLTSQILPCCNSILIQIRILIH